MIFLFPLHSTTTVSKTSPSVDVVSATDTRTPATRPAWTDVSSVPAHTTPAGPSARPVVLATCRKGGNRPRWIILMNANVSMRIANGDLLPYAKLCSFGCHDSTLGNVLKRLANLVFNL